MLMRGFPILFSDFVFRFCFPILFSVNEGFYCMDHITRCARRGSKTKKKLHGYDTYIFLSIYRKIRNKSRSEL